MKKIFQFFMIAVAATFILQACSGIKNLPAAATGASRARIVGNWTLTKVGYVGLVDNTVESVFDQAPPRDFIGSSWQLTNSGNGMYSLNNGMSQTIFWSYNTQDAMGPVFQFKKIYQGDKAKNVTEGYKLIIDQNDGKQMILKSPIKLGDQTAYVIYTFNKN